MAPPTAEADDLDDGLEYDVQLSEDESVEQPNNTNEQAEQQQPDDEVTVSKKRKRSEGQSNFKEKKKMKMELDTEQKKNISTESNTEVITDFINSKISRKNSNLSTLELSELYFSKDNIRSTSEYKKPRTLDNLSDYIIQRFKNMLPGKENKKENKKNKKNKKKEGKKESEIKDEHEEDRKYIAIVSMSAIRACDIHRATKDLNGSSLKLINKNKVDQDLKLLKTTRSRILCCTPGRLQKILNNEDSSLSKNEIKIIIKQLKY
ncbi:uncharacterized protein KGF55_004847 [Candida pseudojiufengensis]|uniref:uncharacterized protein n=1 Tax=Candida pseudojiufengensis TaxID=497109 RepID=UPI00222507CD|nr:uncharacterized protein KGF55_004847 [Candida pseudojiufengensis]KAI5960124.1 hypothetical protein KGF55_004847 [Candida pseudojiufengensis]